MFTKNRDVSLLKAALITILLPLSALSSQNPSKVSESDQWRIAGQKFKQYVEPAGGAFA
jgi:hypothetical protein